MHVPVITKQQISSQKMYVVECEIVWHGPLILDTVNESVCIVCGRYGHSCCYVHSRFVNSFVMIYLIRSKRRGENKKNFMLKVQVLYIKVTVYLMLSMLPDLVIVLGLCFI